MSENNSYTTTSIKLFGDSSDIIEAEICSFLEMTGISALSIETKKATNEDLQIAKNLGIIIFTE